LVIPAIEHPARCRSHDTLWGIMLGNETDRLALLAFKSQINQHPVLSSWNDSNHFCEWEGVTCSHRHQRVTILNLTSKGLIGTISPHVGNLSFLRTIVLRNNDFQGHIPQEFGQLFRLEKLDVGFNSLFGEIPANISLCSNLINLYLDHNTLVGKIPIELGNLLKLVILVLEKNNLTRGIPPSLGNLTSLEYLTFSENSLGGKIPSTLNQLKNLKVLGLNSCKLSGVFPVSLYNLSTIVIFSITDNHFSGNLPSEIGFMLPNIQLFYFGKNQFSGPIPSSLFNVSTIQRVDIASNQFTGKVPLNIGNLKGLTDLLLEYNNLGSGKSGDLDFFTSLANCSYLKSLTISHNQFGGTLPHSIGNFSNQLRQLDLSLNQISGSIPSEIGNLQNLTLLNLNDNHLTGSIPMSIGNLQKLQILVLNSNQLLGRLPSSIRNMSELFLLDLSNNSLEGSIASSFENRILQRLDLSYNNFTGSMPKLEISLSPRLVMLYLAHNALSGSIPVEVENLKSLGYLVVSENRMSGQIPNAIGGCPRLEYLGLQGNFFEGPLPSSLSSLQSLQVLDVSHNKISGKIPGSLEKLPLQNLNLSFNNFEGEVPTKGVFSNVSAIAVLGNYKICGGILELELPKCNIQKSRKHGTLALKVAVGVFISLVLMVALFLIVYSRMKPIRGASSNQLPKDHLKRISYNELREATNGFSPTNLVGVGSYGSVYKGILQQDEGFIAVKVLNLMERGASKSFMAECHALKAVRHRNLLKVLTVCSSADFNGNDFKALVYEFMPNGSLESWIYPSLDEHLHCLNLDQRLNIAIDVASALDYLHNHCDRHIVHCDLKSSNVLLDNDMTAHVGDFGLAKFLSKSTSTCTSNKGESSSVAIRGTIGYIAPGLHYYGLIHGVIKKFYGTMWKLEISCLHCLQSPQCLN
ncbi:hypothetical protein AQUCO_03100020v1, partial [Aquilegia coerulea]